MRSKLCRGFWTKRCFSCFFGVLGSKTPLFNRSTVCCGFPWADSGRRSNCLINRKSLICNGFLHVHLALWTKRNAKSASRRFDFSSNYSTVRQFEYSSIRVFEYSSIRRSQPLLGACTPACAKRPQRTSDRSGVASSSHTHTIRAGGDGFVRVNRHRLCFHEHRGRGDDLDPLGFHDL